MIQKKVCMLGAFGVGKTSLVRRFVESVFDEKYLTAIGVKIDKKIVSIDGQELMLLLWDIEGQDVYNTVKTAYIRGAAGYLLVSDGTRRETISTAVDLKTRIQRDLGEIPHLLLVNKSDLPAAVSVEEVTRLLDGIRPAAALEVSALTGEGCAELAAKLAELVREGKVERSPARAAAGARRREVLASALECLRRAEAAPDLSCAADDLREAVRGAALHFEPGAGSAELDDNVLNRIFARFCVGK